MKMIHRDGLIHKNADELSRWALPNESSKPAADGEELNREVPIMAVCVSGLAENFWQSVESSYKGNWNIVFLVIILKSKNVQQDLVAQLDEPWKAGFLAG